MACKTILIPGGAAIICGLPREKRCFQCGAPADKLCDWRVGKHRNGRLKTCDRPMCPKCTYSPAPEKDLCPGHAKQWAAHPANKEKRMTESTGTVGLTPYRHHPFETQCRSCGASIVWFRTKAGKKMPVNSETTKPTDAEHQLDLSRHKSHFATCPDSATHRKPR